MEHLLPSGNHCLEDSCDLDRIEECFVDNHCVVWRGSVDCKAARKKFTPEFFSDILLHCGTGRTRRILLGPTRPGFVRSSPPPGPSGCGCTIDGRFSTNCPPFLNSMTTSGAVLTPRVSTASCAVRLPTSVADDCAHKPVR